MTVIATLDGRNELVGMLPTIVITALDRRTELSVWLAELDPVWKLTATKMLVALPVTVV